LARVVTSVHDLRRERRGEESGHLKRKGELKKLKLQLKADLRQEEYDYEEEIKNLKEIEGKELQYLRDEFEGNHRKLCDKAEDRLQNLRDDLELRRKVRQGVDRV
jgi:hypothetical protein